MESMTKKVIEFWDTHFEVLKPEKIKVEEMKVETKLDELLKRVGDESTSLLEIGTGSGYAILTAGILGEKLERKVGFDSSKHAVDFLNETIKLSNLTGYEIHHQDHTILETFEDNCFDSIITLNVLDVLEPTISSKIITEIKRILKPGGLFLLKLNFYLTDEMILRTKMENVYDNVFTLNGVLRAVNYKTEEWITLFEPFKLLEQAEFERIKNGPLDRVLLFQK